LCGTGDALAGASHVGKDTGKRSVQAAIIGDLCANLNKGDGYRPRYRRALRDFDAISDQRLPEFRQRMSKPSP